MARPRKIGMSYFPLDCQMDDKIEMLEAEHDLAGFAVYIKLLQSIYQTENGELDMAVVFRWKTLGKTYGIPPENLRNMVSTMLEIGLFCSKCFYERQVLTSNGIKKRIGQVSEMRFKERKRKEISFPDGKPELSGRKGAQKEKEKEKEKETSNKEEIIVANAPKIKSFLEMLDACQKIYPGTKRGTPTEFKEFEKKFKSEFCREFFLKIYDGINAKKETNKKMGATAGAFIPEWPHFKTYLNQRRWEEETPEKEKVVPFKEPTAFKTIQDYNEYWGGPAKPITNPLPA